MLVSQGAGRNYTSPPRRRAELHLSVLTFLVFLLRIPDVSDQYALRAYPVQISTGGQGSRDGNAISRGRHQCIRLVSYQTPTFSVYRAGY